MSEPKELKQAAVDKKETRTQPVLQRKEHRGAYLGPSGPPVEMTGDTFVNPTPTVTPAAPAAPPPASTEGDGSA